MSSRLREPFGKAGLVVAVVALVAALVGGAYAASSATDSAKRNHKAKKNKKAKGVSVARVRKIAKQEAQKYANSNPGPAGPQGPVGAAGPKGDTGTNGTNGTSVTSAEFEGEEGPCVDGGSKFTSTSGETYACNGAAGPAGPITGDLPSGVSLKGTWITPVRGVNVEAGQNVPISFGLSLSEAPEAHYLNPAGEEFNNETFEFGPAGPECPGSAAAPEAEPGNVCVYATVQEGVSFAIFNSELFTKYGVALTVIISEFGSAFGTWAVTAP